MRPFTFRRTVLTAPALTLAALALAVAVSSAPRSARADAPAPAHKDSKAFFKPKEAAFSVAVSPAEAKPGDTVTYRVTVKLAPTWHIYKYSKTQPEEGPRNTQFDFFDMAGLKPDGDWKASREPLRKKEEAFPNLPFVEFYEDEVTWSLPLKVPAGTEPGNRVLRNQVYYQLCNPSGCKLPTYSTLPEAVLTVLGGGATAAAGPESAVKEDATATTAPTPAPPTPQASSTSAAPSPTPSDSEASVPSASPPVASAPEASASSAPSPAVTNSVEKSLQEGLLPFLLMAVGGGLIALVMPCVWPMVPITVNFFVKQGQANKGKTLGLAITYSLAIIGIFTLVGVLFSAFLGAASLQRLANAAWLNIAVAGLFLAFGLSLLGMFEFRLPNFLLNATSQRESRGGLVGVIFMALTLTITSFTCTFPVVGGLLAIAAGGNYFYPVIGLATFATVLALPFFLLALAPGLLSKMPKSGDWMNAVKVVGGLIEIGAAFKFINTAECTYVVPEDAWFDAQVVLAIWVALALVCGIYLLGVFRTDHDQDAVKVGPGRILSGSFFLFLALFLAPALFGRPPQSRIWDRLVVGILPADAGELRSTAVAEAGSGCKKEDATSSDPKVAIRQQKDCHGVSWGMSLDAALEQARAENKPVLIDFTGVNCANCRLMEANVLPKRDVVPLLSRFVTVQLYTDIVPIKSITPKQREELAEGNQEVLKELANESTNPFYVVLSPDRKVLETIGFSEPGTFAGFLRKALAKHQDDKKVAQVDVTQGR